MNLTDTCEAQLVGAFNGINPRIGFLKSNQYFPAGLKHDLHFILNVFRESEITSEMESPHLRTNDILIIFVQHATKTVSFLWITVTGVASIMIAEIKMEAIRELFCKVLIR